MKTWVAVGIAVLNAAAVWSEPRAFQQTYAKVYATLEKYVALPQPKRLVPLNQTVTAEEFKKLTKQP